MNSEHWSYYVVTGAGYTPGIPSWRSPACRPPGQRAAPSYQWSSCQTDRHSAPSGSVLCRLEDESQRPWQCLRFVYEKVVASPSVGDPLVVGQELGEKLYEAAKTLMY